MSNGKTCDNHHAARRLGGAHPKSQPPRPSRDASGPSNAGGKFTQPPSNLGEEEDDEDE
jgi:hypothetical protein